MSLSQTLTKEEVTEWLREVKDPEIPVVDVVGMGIVRDVTLADAGVTVAITPTYSGCPAMEVIARDIREALEAKGLAPVTVSLVQAPAWTTDWMDADTKAAMKAYGIAPPHKTCATSPFVSDARHTPCPRCDGNHTELRSRFGSTACKALYYCNHCDEPFELFKCI